jgi:hypothetical protein
MGSRGVGSLNIARQGGHNIVYTHSPVPLYVVALYFSRRPLTEHRNDSCFQRLQSMFLGYLQRIQQSASKLSGVGLPLFHDCHRLSDRPCTQHIQHIRGGSAHAGQLN